MNVGPLAVDANVSSGEYSDLVVMVVYLPEFS
jgi:hypothetical protein